MTDDFALDQLEGLPVDPEAIYDALESCRKERLPKGDLSFRARVNVTLPQEEINVQVTPWQLTGGSLAFLRHPKPSASLVHDVKGVLRAVWRPLESYQPEISILSLGWLGERRIRTGRLFLKVGEHGAYSQSVKFLPPIAVTFVLPHDYPSERPPCVSVAAAWLSTQQTQSLKVELSNLAAAELGLPVCYSLISWLESSALEHLGIGNTLVLSEDTATGEHLIIMAIFALYEAMLSAGLLKRVCLACRSLRAIIRGSQLQFRPCITASQRC